MTKPVDSAQFKSSHPQFEFNKGHRLLFVREIFSKIIPGFWRCLKSLTSLKVDESIKTAFEKKKAEDPYLPDAYKELQHRRTLGPCSVMKYCDYLQSAHKNKFVSYQSFLFSGEAAELPDRGNNDFVFIPVVLQGLVRDHIVTVVYDAKNNRVELYDPKGLTSKDHSEDIRGKKLKLSDLLMQVSDKYGDDNTKLWENTKKHQKDYHNCGVYILDYFERRLQGEKPEEIANKARLFSYVNNTLRAQMLRNIVNT